MAANTKYKEPYFPESENKKENLDQTHEPQEEQPLNQPNEFTEEKQEKRPFSETSKHVFRNITVEPIMFLYVMGFILVIQTSQNLSLEKACRVNLNYSSDICDSLRAQTLENQNVYEKETQKLLASYISYKTYIQASIPSVIALFVGSFSDKIGRRKIFLVIPLTGQVLMCVSNIINTYFFYQLPLEALIFSEVIIDAVSGSFCVAIFTMFAYITSVTTEEERTFRMGLINFSMSVGFPIGMSMSGILLKKLGYYGCYGVAIGLTLLNLMYTTCILKDPPRSSEQKQHDNRGPRHMFRIFFDLSNIRDTVQVVFKQGPNNRRTRMIVYMLVVGILFGPMFGEINVLYLNVRYRFNWDEVKFSLFQTYNFIAHTIGTIFSITVFSKYLSWHDSVLGIISSVSKISAAFFYALPSNEKIFLLAPILDMLNGTSLLAMRSLVSKLVSPNEIGKVTSLFGLVENLMPLVYVPLYTNVYKATMDTFPGAVFMMGAAMTLPAVFVFLWLFYEHRRNLRIQRHNAAVLYSYPKQNMN